VCVDMWCVRSTCESPRARESSRRNIVLSHMMEAWFSRTTWFRGDRRASHSVAVDHVRDRILVTDARDHRVRVWSSSDRSPLFEFGSHGHAAGCFDRPRGICVDNQGRIIVADSNNFRLQAFSSEGQYLASFDCGFGELPSCVAFDEDRGLIVFSAFSRVFVIGANQWLGHTLFWSPHRHCDSPIEIQKVVETMTMVRSLEYHPPVALLPNEILFEIFESLVRVTEAPANRVQGHIIISPVPWRGSVSSPQTQIVLGSQTCVCA